MPALQREQRTEREGDAEQERDSSDGKVGDGRQREPK
jgi:hypothetical protein